MFSTGSELPAVQSDEPLLPLRAGVRHAIHRRPARTRFPKIDVLFSAVLTSSPGIPLRADWTVSSAVVAQIARPAARRATRPNVTVNLLKPDEMRSDRVNELDLRVGEDPAASGSTRANIALDLLNALNLEHDPRAEPGVHPGWRVAGADRHADAGDDGADGEDHRAVRLLRRHDVERRDRGDRRARFLCVLGVLCVQRDQR